MQSCVPLSVSAPTLCPLRLGRGSCKQPLAISCNAPQKQEHGGLESDDSAGTPGPVVGGRRELLLRSSGLCVGAAATLGSRSSGPALADPVQPPPLNKCHPITDADCLTYNCCPPYKEEMEIVDFVPPGAGVRQRRPARELMQDPEYLKKFENAIYKMKSLPEDDPWNFMQQANIHCAYCVDAYEQTGYPNVRLQVHFGWIFLPWHRFYIYFWERILGKLIGDDTFAIPYWNWDDEAEMTMPQAYWNSPESFLYDANRDKRHYTALMDYQYAIGDSNPTPQQHDTIVLYNRNRLRRMFSKDNLSHPELFMGKPVRAGQNTEEAPNWPGDLEMLHNTIHNWTGEIFSPYWDMGNFHTAGRDPIFFGHHANIDRLWDIYRRKRGRVEFKDTDWLDATFLFYDENRKLVRCKVRQGLLPEQLGYQYKSEEPTWEDVGLTRSFLSLRKASVKSERARGANSTLSRPTEFGGQPRVLDATIRALVDRPTSSISTDTTVLIVDDIKFDHKIPLRFDVYVTKPTYSDTGLGELAGSFVNVPHGISHGTAGHPHNTNAVQQKRAALRLGIGQVLEDLDYILEGTGRPAPVDDNKLVVTLVPRLGQVTIGGIRIESIPTNDDGED